MDAAAELGWNPVSKHQIQPEYGEQGNIHFPCSADHEQDWQPYPVDPYSCYMCYHTYIHTYFQHAYVITVVGVAREAHISWSMVTCKGSTRLELR